MPFSCAKDLCTSPTRLICVRDSILHAVVHDPEGAVGQWPIRPVRHAQGLCQAQCLRYPPTYRPTARPDAGAAGLRAEARFGILAGSQQAAQRAEGFVLNLPDAFAGKSDRPTELVECLWFPAGQAETVGDDAALPFG